jgi:exonuclease SbcC
MTLETLRLKRVLRFSTDLQINFRDLGTGLIAFTGENGEGKTTALEAPLAGAFREFPSRASKELLDYVTGTDGYIETTFALEGQGLYRARLNLDGPHRKAEGILAHIDADGQEQILNDGKVTTYDQQIAQLLPPKAVLLASVFSAQNRAGSFGELDRKGRRELFAALLGLEHLQQMADHARGAAGLVEQAVAKLTPALEVLERDTTEALEAALGQEAVAIEVERTQIEARRRALQRDIADAEAALAGLQDLATAHAATKAQADRLDLDIAAATTEHETVRVTHERESTATAVDLKATQAATREALAALDRQLADTSLAVAEAAAIDDTLRATLKDADERIAGNRKYLEMATEIRAAVAALAKVDADLEQVRQGQQHTATTVETLRHRERVLVDSLGAIEKAEADLRRITADAGLLNAVPCGGVGEYATCQFLTSVTAAQARIPALQVVADGRAQVVAALEAVRADLKTRATQATAEQARVVALTKERVTHGPLAAKLSILQQAEDRIAHFLARKVEATADAARQQAAAQTREVQRQADLRTRRAEREAEGLTQQTYIAQRWTAREAELVDRATHLEASVHADTLRLGTLRTELARTASASADAAAQTALLALRRAEWDASTTDLARVTHQRETVEQRHLAFSARRMEADDLRARRTDLQADLVEWGVLAKALGRDGLQTIEIDEAGPTVSRLTNQLLESSYGARFTVELVTQEPRLSKSKDGQTMRDVFEIKVFDARDGGAARDIGDLSGGERVIVEEACKSAIALLVNSRNVMPCRTMWRDETTGALNPENALRYMAMLRAAHELGGFHQTIFVTHNPDAARLADAQVHFADGAVEVRFPPYAEAA